MIAQDFARIRDATYLTGGTHVGIGDAQDVFSPLICSMLLFPAWFSLLCLGWETIRRRDYLAPTSLRAQETRHPIV